MQFSTELSKYIWRLKDQSKEYKIKWKVMANVAARKDGIGHCKLCIAKKFYIIFQPNTATLNERRDIITMCRHAHKFMLGNI